MAKHNDVGSLGEQIAQNYLKQQGYQILAANWRWGKGELDLIAQWKQCLIFVETKTREQPNFGFPEEGVSAKKQQLMYELALEYSHQHHWEGEIRFDILAITLQPKLDIRHFQDAFFPNWMDD